MTGALAWVMVVNSGYPSASGSCSALSAKALPDFVGFTLPRLPPRCFLPDLGGGAHPPAFLFARLFNDRRRMVLCKVLTETQGH